MSLLIGVGCGTQPFHVSSGFTAGFAITMLGALLLAVSSWWYAARGWRKKGAAVSTALLGLRAAAVGLFSAGALWQLVGYLRLEYTKRWTW